MIEITIDTAIPEDVDIICRSRFIRSVISTDNIVILALNRVVAADRAAHRVIIYVAVPKIVRNFFGLSKKLDTRTKKANTIGANFFNVRLDCSK